VGRLFTKEGNGTAFYVAPGVLASAHHVLCGTDMQFTTQLLAPTKDYVKQVSQPILGCSIYPNTRKAWNAKDAEASIKDSDPGKTAVSRDVQTQNDFNFSEVIVANDKYLIPYAGKLAVGLEVAVIGYPGLPSVDKGLDGKPSWFEEQRVGVEDVRNAFLNMFGYKHIAVGVIEHIAVTERVFTTTATTLPGVSGSPVIVLNSPSTFCGIHIEGWSDSNYNVAVSVHHPNFVQAYVIHVVPHLPTPLAAGVVAYLRGHAALLESVANSFSDLVNEQLSHIL